MMTVSAIRKKMIAYPEILCLLHDYSDSLGIILANRTPSNILSVVAKQRNCSMAMFGMIPYDGVEPNTFDVSSWKWTIEFAAQVELNDDLIRIEQISVTPHGILLWWTHPKKSQKRLHQMLQTIVSKFNEYQHWTSDQIQLVPKLL
jgi:hypothetical protein